MRRLPGICQLYLLALLFIAAPAGAQKSEEHPGVFSFLVASGLREGADSRDPARELSDYALSNPANRPAFVVSLGNNTASGAASEFESLRAGMKPAQDAGVGFYAVPGSADVSCLAQGKERFARTFGRLYQSFEYNNAHFILLDSTVALRAEGHVDKAQLDWLEKDLKRVKQDTPIILFVYHSLVQQPVNARPLDNDFDILARLLDHNVTAMFIGDAPNDASFKTNGVLTLTERGFRQGSLYRVTVSPLLVSIDRVDAALHAKPARIANIPASSKVKASQLRVTWDDPDIPYLERRRPAATLSPRAFDDNPDKERAEYRIDSNPWRPLIKDRRDIWSDTFQTRDIPIGMHTADVRLTTSNNSTSQAELVFEVERDEKESTRHWAIDLPGPIQSNPLLSGDTLYVTCLDGKLYALNSANNKRRWFFPAKAAIYASPVIDSGVIYVGSTDKTLYAVEAASGRMKWKYDSDAPILTTAAVAAGTVCFSGDGGITGVDINSGQRRWSHPAAGPFESAVATDGSAFYIAGWDNTLLALDAASGVERWHAHLDEAESIGIASPCVLNGRVYVAGIDGTLNCFETSHGHQLWSKSVPFGEDPLGCCSPAGFGSTILICGCGPKGSVYSFDAVTGARKWVVDIGQRIEATGVRMAPNGLTFAIAGMRGRCVVMDAVTGRRLWGYELGPGNVFSTPEYDGDRLYTASMQDDVQAINGPGVGKR